MKRTLILVVGGLLLGATGCASTSTGSLAYGGNLGARGASSVSSAYRDLGGGRTGGSMGVEMSTREPRESGSMGADRGVPTPQPARDPSSFSPVPQPPLPGPPSGAYGITVRPY